MNPKSCPISKFLYFNVSDYFYLFFCHWDPDLYHNCVDSRLFFPSTFLWDGVFRQHVTFGKFESFAKIFVLCS